MARWGMVIDLDKCVGCQACIVSCKEENNVPHGSPEEQRSRREIYWHKMIAVTKGKYPYVRTEIIPMPCMQCDHPPCVTVCPAKATFQRDDGIVVQYYRRCIGCNPNEVIGVDFDPLSGQSSFFNTRVKIYKATV